MAAALLFPAPAAAQGYFVNQVADGAPNDVGLHSSLAIDAQGDPHIAYFDVSAARLRYARKRGPTWTLETPDPDAAGDFCAIALDSQGNPAISYFTGVTADLKYASKSGAIWTVETPDDGGTAQLWASSSLAFDAQGNPNIAYYDMTNGNLKFAKKAAGSWTRETADGSANDIGQWTSLAFDADGDPHISCYDVTNGNLMHATKSNGIWSLETVDGAVNDVGSYTSIALDNQGGAHISYFDDSLDDLKYARKASGAWTTVVVDGASPYGTWTSIAADDAGTVHIVYWYITGGNLKYATKAGTFWTTETVDPSPDIVGEYASLELDGQGKPHVSYYNRTAGNLHYAHGAVRALAPASAVTWAVGSLQTISWWGVGPVDVLLSLDGGRSFNKLVGSTADNTIAIRVPHTPTRFGRIRILRSSPFSSSETDSFLRIDSTISLMKFDARAVESDPSESGRTSMQLSWETRPEPPTIAGYRLEKAIGSDGAFASLHDELLTAGTFIDTDAAPDARYRLVTVNGLGEEFVLGETSATALLPVERDIAVHPNPALDGRTVIRFRVPFDPRVGASTMPVQVTVYDASGRLVKRLASSAFATGVQRVAWDGVDGQGRPVPPGTYFAQMTTGSGFTASERIVVVR